MVNIKYIEDTQGNKIFPVTHEKAVRDSNGVTIESKLQMQTELINQAQMEIGAVPSDLTPTKDSTNWVTSGGVLGAFKTSFGDLLSDETLNNSSYSVVKCNIYQGKWNDVGNNSRKSIFVPLNTGFAYQVTAYDTVFYAVLTDTTVTARATPAFAPGYTDRVTMGANDTVKIIGVDGQYLWIREDNSLNFQIVKCYNVINESLVDNSLVPNSKKLLSSDGIYDALGNDKVFFDEKVAGFDDITSTSQTNASILTVTLDTTNDIIKFDATGTFKENNFADVFISNQNLIAGKRYKATFDYTASLSSGFDGWVACYNSAGTNIGTSYADSSSGVLTYIFTSDGNTIKFRTKSASIGSTGKYIYLSNFKIVLYDDIKTLPMLTSETDSLMEEVFDKSLFSNATKTATYVGEKIPTIGKTSRIGYKYIMGNGSCQGGAAYGDYWFQFTDHHSSVSIYSFTTKSLHSTVSLTSDSNAHCNTACFGYLYYDENDDFPLLYTSLGGNDNYNHAQVWRVVLDNDVFSVTKVQDITFPTGDGWDGCQIYMDNELKAMWCHSKATGHNVFSRFDVPSVVIGDSVHEVTLTASDVKDSFTTRSDTNRQGGVVKNGILYLLNGVPSWGTYTTLNVYDLWGKRLINIVDIYYSLGITREFEGCGIYDNKLIAATNGGGIYELYF